MMRTQEFKKDSQVFKIAPTKKKQEATKQVTEDFYLGNTDLPASHGSLSPEVKPSWKTIGQPNPANARARCTSPKSPTQQARLRELRPYLNHNRNKFLTIQSAVATVQTHDTVSGEENEKKPPKRFRRVSKKSQVKD